MAIYKQVYERMLQPYHHIGSNGQEAKHDTPANELATDDNGNPAVAYGELERRNNRLIYTSADDVAKMTESELEKAFYAFDTASVNRMASFGAIAELDRNSAPSEDSQDAPEPAINATDAARREAQKRGVPLENVHGTGSDGKITVDDVKAEADNPKDDNIRTWEED